MATQRYSVTPHPIDTLLTWVKSGEIAIPEIQRPFVWEATKVRNLLDSLYQGYPVGYLIAWRNPTVRLKDGTTSAGIAVRDLLIHRGDKHHVFPRKHLQRAGASRSSYNQIANFVMAQSEINIAIGDKAPEVYFAELREQVNAGPKRYGGITDPAELRANLEMNCLPLALLDGKPLGYDAFLVERRRLMAEKIRQWVNVL